MLFWNTLRMMYRMPGQRWSLWRAYWLFRKVRCEGIALLDATSGFVFR